MITDHHILNDLLNQLASQIVISACDVLRQCSPEKMPYRIQFFPIAPSLMRWAFPEVNPSILDAAMFRAGLTASRQATGRKPIAGMGDVYPGLVFFCVVRETWILWMPHPGEVSVVDVNLDFDGRRAPCEDAREIAALLTRRALAAWMLNHPRQADEVSWPMSDNHPVGHDFASWATRCFLPRAR